MAEYAKNLSQTTKIIDYQDAFSKNMARRAEKANFFTRILFQHEAKRLAKYEEQAFHFFQHHFIIAENDRDALFFEEKKQIEICQNGIELDFFDEKKFQHVAKKYDLVFVGNMGYHPNIEAAQYLVNHILPLLKKEKRNINVLIAGARPSLSVKNLASENVTVQGWMEDIRMAYSESRIFVAPLFQGSGQQNKVLETMAMGVPCITTSIVNASTGAKPNEAILIADTAQAFADKIIFLLKEKNEYNQLKINALQFVNQNFSWQKATKPLQRVVNDE
jgi:glycosyltransferase involved in cell wall biosynthesis